MGTLHHPSGGFPLDPQSEAHERRDIGAADTSPTVGSDTTWTDVDRMWAAEMERRDRAAAYPSGCCNAACEAFGCDLYVPVGQAGDILCDSCRSQGDAWPLKTPPMMAVGAAPAGGRGDAPGLPAVRSDGRQAVG